jgi:Domain of unknown function (DUF4192)
VPHCGVMTDLPDSARRSSPNRSDEPSSADRTGPTPAAPPGVELAGSGPPGVGPPGVGPPGSGPWRGSGSPCCGPPGGELPSGSGSPTAGLPDARAAVRLTTPGELVAALPALLGFHPVSSLVLVSLGGPSGRGAGLVVRLDLPPPGGSRAAAALAIDALRSDDPVAAAVVVVGDRDLRRSRAAPPRAGLAAAVTAQLTRQGLGVAAAVWAAAAADGAPWRCYGPCGCAGTVQDPAASPVTALTVLQGRVVLADRAELGLRVAPAGPATLGRRDALLRTLPSLPAGTDAARLARLAEAVAAAAAGPPALDDERVVDLAVTLGLPAGRDAAVRHCLGPDALAAEELWAALARGTPDPEAAEPAALLALSALLRGDGALARVALGRAGAAWPGHRFTRLLRGALDSAVPPQRLREWLLRSDRAAG